MELPYSADEFVALCSDALRAKIDTADSGISRITFGHPGIKAIDINTGIVEEVRRRLLSEYETNETTLYNSRFYEVFVKRETRFIGRDLFDLTKHDAENKVTYILSRPSDEYLFFLLFRLSQIAPVRYSFPISSYMLRREIKEHDNEVELSVFDVIRLVSSSFMSLRITTEDEMTLDHLQNYANAFFFQISYNLDTALVPLKNLDELVRTRRIRSLRRSNTDDLEAPKRLYIADLVYHYQLAVASDSPPLEYLSYYHVLEHFFEDCLHG